MHGPPPPQFPVPYQPPLPGPPPGPPPGPGLTAAPRGRRLLAWTIDTGLLVFVAFLLGGMTWTRLQTYVAEDVPSKAWSAGGALLLSGGNVEKAASEFGAGVWGTFVGTIEQALALLVLAELLYQFAGMAWAGRTVGKTATHLRVRHAKTVESKPGKGRALRRALLTTASGTGLYALAWVLLLEGLFFFALLLWLAAVALFLANSVPALAGSRRTLADRVGGTVVVPGPSLAAAMAAARQGVQQAIESDSARRLQDLGRRAGRQSAEKVREVTSGDRAQQVQGNVKRLGGRIKGAYQDRRGAPADRPQPVQPPPPPEPPALPPPPPPYGQPGWHDPARQAPYTRRPSD